MPRFVSLGLLGSVDSGVVTATNAPFWVQDPAGFEGPTYAPDPWDTCWIGGEQLPGIVEVSALPTEAVDIQNPSNRDGAAIVMRGYLPGPVDIRITLWTPKQWEVYQNVLRKLWRKHGKIAPSSLKPEKAAELARTGADRAQEAAVEIRHPALNGAMNITAVVLTGVSVPVPTDKPKQGRVVSWKCQQYVPVDKKVRASKVKGARGDISVPTTKTYQPSGPNLTPVNVSVAPPSATNVDP